MSWGHARGQDNARTVLITIGRILTGHIPTKLRKRLGQGFIPFLDDLFLSNTNRAMGDALHCLEAAPVWKVCWERGVRWNSKQGVESKCTNSYHGEQPRCDDVMRMVLALQIGTFKLVSSMSR